MTGCRYKAPKPRPSGEEIRMAPHAFDGYLIGDGPVFKLLLGRDATRDFHFTKSTT